MKTKFVFSAMAVFLFLTLTTGCDEDDKNPLEGTKWYLDEVNGDEPEDDEYLLFTSDRMKVWTWDSYYGCYDYNSFKYKVDGDELSIWDNEEDEWWDMEFQIEDNHLLVEDDEGDERDYRKSGFDEDDLEDEECDKLLTAKKITSFWKSNKNKKSEQIKELVK